MPNVEHFEGNKYCIRIYGQAHTYIHLTHDEGVKIAKELDALLWELDRQQSDKVCD